MEMIIPYGLEFKKFPLIDGKYIKLEFRKEFKKFIPQFLRILFWNQKIRKCEFFYSSYLISKKIFVFFYFEN